ncbi:TetR/AcrR family transcriptional regulator [Marinococcus halophilus]|uniref:TetR family transcriptional regulator n=1 Tax=Marinococcus halophilus TaxID=1371 RepID=A0A510Y8Z4_MARHA|nr:TetR/AcrR family transcriptional regulator [Marinococcus halophilus]OZT79189.1 TetR/AcrR family transcriptional regulator [Marinococcus halophilus]GEK59852.1 TetR family transcriptional regulator [Marinococcus halophilus]
MRGVSKKEVILNTAENLFYQHGFHAVGVKSILNEVGVAPMTMYYHFHSKETLIVEILKRRELRYFDFLQKEIDRDNGLAAYAETLIKAHTDWMKTDGLNGCLFLRAKQEYEGVNEEIAALSKEHKKTLQQKIEQELKTFNSSKQAGTQLVMILEGITSTAQVMAMEEVEEAAFRIAKNMRADSQ